MQARHPGDGALSSRGSDPPRWIADSHLAIPALFLAGMLLVIGLSLLHGRVPGDLGDARFNSYMLEHAYRWITRRDTSFWNAPFYVPYPLTTAFSDDHLGSAPFYTAFRVLGFDRIEAFQLWYALGYVLNFAASCVCLRSLGFSRSAASLGAFFFAFAQPMTAQEGHAQLVWRFCAPMALLALLRFRARPSLNQASALAFWVVWQAACSLYIAYFLILLLSATTVAMVALDREPRIRPLRSLPSRALAFWRRQSSSAKAGFLVAMLALGSILVLLCLPYARASRLYKFVRPWWEIASLLPRPASYFLSLQSTIYPTSGSWFASVPHPGEDALFIGTALPGAALIALASRRSRHAGGDERVWSSLIALLLLVGITLYVGGFTLYRPLVLLPGANAIRAVGRIILVLLLPLSVLLAASVDAILSGRLPRRACGPVVLALAAWLVADAACGTHSAYTTQEWQDRMTALAASVPANLPDKPVLLLAPEPGVPMSPLRQIDAMLFAQDRGWRTMNGYSGNDPPVRPLTGKCQDVTTALDDAATFLKANGRPVPDLASHLVLMGYPNCPAAARP